MIVTDDRFQDALPDFPATTVRTRAGLFPLLERGLVISGRRERSQHANPAYHQVEIGIGEFRIVVDLPWSVERDAVNASYEVGFLQVELPRKAARTIPVADGNGSETE